MNEREKDFRDIVTRLVKPESGVSPEYNFLGLEQAAWLLGLLDEARASVEKLGRFKSYVHQRIDEAAVPSDPDPKGNAEHGCRIEGRLDFLIGQRDVAQRDRDKVAAENERCHGLLDKARGLGGDETVSAETLELRLASFIRDCVAEVDALMKAAAREQSLPELMDPFRRWPVVYDFARAMIDKLDRNREKKGGREGWINDDPKRLFVRVLEEIEELRPLVEAPAGLTLFGKNAARDEAADVANMAMMVADALDALRDRRAVREGGSMSHLHALAVAVRRYHREHPGHTRVENGVSLEGLALLEAVEALPKDGVVVSRVALQLALDGVQDPSDFNRWCGAIDSIAEMLKETP